MSAAALLRLTSIRGAIIVGASVSSFGLSTFDRSRICNDSPAHASWPGHSSLVGQGLRAQYDQEQARKAKTQTKQGDAEHIDEATDVETYAPSFEDDDDNAWKQFSRNLDVVLDGINRIEWSGLGDKITDFMLPTWAKHIPAAIQKLNFELSMQPGTLADEIWEEAHDAVINPEILWNARVRISNELCEEELRFRRKRKESIIEPFKRYLNITEDVDPDDVPTIAICGSGGGLRAMVAGTSSYLCTQEAGLFDCCTYTAGVSGSCWLQTLFFSSLGKQDHRTLLDHIKSRIGTHIAFPPSALKLLTSAPTNKYILSGFVEKLRGDPGATFGLVDVYSLMLAARYMVPKGDLDVHDYDLKLSNQRRYLEKGEYPLPIYTLVRHEIPVKEEKQKEENKDKPTTPVDTAKAEARARKQAWFQWLELHPFEVFCEEFGAGIPTWSLGRPFEGGQNKLLDTGVALPEIRQSLLLGIYGSAFCATLAHYYKEIRPVLASIKGFGSLDELVQDKNEDLVRLHPVEPATIPNYVYGMKGQLPPTCPESVYDSDHLQLMDAGMSNNLPIYPLLRPGRDVDVLIAFDASADVKQENWLSAVDGYAKQRGVKSWPVGTGWPKKTSKPQEHIEEYEQATASSPQEAAGKLAEARDQARKDRAEKEDKNERELAVQHHGNRVNPDELGYCNIWVGTKQERSSGEEPPPSKRLDWEDSEDTTFRLSEPDATMAVVYFPLLPNEKVAGVDPDKTDFLSTWNFIYTPEQVDQVIELARTNFREGAEPTKRTIRAVYERKKAARLAKEENFRIKFWKRQLREHGDTFSA